MTTAALLANSALPAGFRKKIAADAEVGEKHAAGIVYVAPDGDILLLRRSGAEANFAGHWALPGGGVDDGETPAIGASRESKEEIGRDVDPSTMKPLDRRRTPTGLAFHTFAVPVSEKFVPKLNEEHSGYAWSPINNLPGPMHPAVQQTLEEQVGVTADMKPEDWNGLRDGFLKWTKEEEAEPEHISATDSALTLALDKESVREIDRDGRMFVKRAAITKANVCPYRGAEIPGWEDLGLDRDKIYQLLRDPEEIRKAAASSNGAQLLQKHIPVNADDHKPYDTVGSVGTDAEFDGEYLWNSLSVWAQSAIDGIASDKKKELSCGYHYKPDMTPGNFGGKHFDGIMREIKFHHVALVEDGRAGPDVVVGDSTENLNMKSTRFARAALMLTASALRPILAKDAQVDLMPIFKGVTAKGFKAKPVAMALDTALKGKLAKDASLKQVADMLDNLEETKPSADEEVTEEQEKSMEIAAKPKADDILDPALNAGTAGFDAEPLKAFLKEKGVADEDILKACDMLPKAATDEDPDAEAKKKKADEEKAAKDAEMKDMVSKGAMDAALQATAASVTKAVRETERGIRTALSEVRPWVGELPASLAFDSAADVYRHSLGMLSVEGAKTLHADALLPVLRAQKKPGARDENRSDRSDLAMDAASMDEATKIAPGLANITIGA